MQSSSSSSSCSLSLALLPSRLVLLTILFLLWNTASTLAFGSKFRPSEAIQQRQSLPRWHHPCFDPRDPISTLPIARRNRPVDSESGADVRAPTKLSMSTMDEAEGQNRKRKSLHGEDNNNSDTDMTLSYVEFYSGIGGWTLALEEAVSRIMSTNGTRKINLQRLGALDHSDLCTSVFEHNFGSDKRAHDISRLSLKQVETWSATLWAMSPPCQPHTRQHSNQSEDLSDPRSKSFLHLCDLLQEMTEESLPRVIVLENVIGFESSKSCDRWCEVLHGRNFRIGHFHLTPAQVGIPNDRPRYFCVGVQQPPACDEAVKDGGGSVRDAHGSCNDVTPAHDLSRFLVHGRISTDSETASSLQAPRRIQTSIGPLGVAENITGVGDVGNPQPASESDALPSISSFLDPEGDASSWRHLRIPEKVLNSNSAWCFDIVTPLNRRSACFTSAYGKYNKGTGSILYETRGSGMDSDEQAMDDSTRTFKLVSPEERSFDKDWTKQVDVTKLRYFSGKEMGRLMGFPMDRFAFPASITPKQQWKLLGNSLNVMVAARIVELGVRIALGFDIVGKDAKE